MKTRLFLVYLSEFLSDGYYVGLFILLPFIAKELHLNLFQIGLLQTTINILLIILAIPIVRLLITHGALKLLIFVLLFFMIGFGGIFLVHSFFSLFLFFIILGIGFALYATTGSHIRLNWFDKETRGKEFGKLSAVGDIAKASFSVVCGLLVGIIGWRYTSLSFGLLLGIFVFIFLFYLNKFNRREKIEKTKEFLTHAPYKYLLKQKKFLLALITGILDDGANAPFYAFLPFLLLYKGVPPLYLGVFTGLYYGGNILSRLVFGRLVDKIGNAKTLILLDIAMSLVTLCLVISPTLALTAATAILLGFITEGTDPATQAMAAESLDHIENTHKASGIRMIAIGSTRAIYPFFIGIIANKFGITGVFYTLSFLALLPLIPAFLFIRTKSNIT